MEIDIAKIGQTLQKLRARTQHADARLDECLRLSPQDAKYMDKVLDFLSYRIYEPKYTTEIRDEFPSLLLLIVTKAFPIAGPIGNNTNGHELRCIALSKLVHSSQDILQYSLKYFCTTPAPFGSTSADQQPAKKRTKTPKLVATDLEIVQCCHRFLTSDPIFYRKQWNWSEFLSRFMNKGCDLQRLHCNAILVNLTNMSAGQLKFLNRNIPQNVQIANEMSFVQHRQTGAIAVIANEPSEPQFVWTFDSDVVTNIQGVLLTIFDVLNYRYYQKTDGLYDRTVMVESTKINLRSLALGISFGKAICLSGPVGCGKTTLVEYLARQTGRVTIQSSANSAVEKENYEAAADVNGSSKKRKKTKKPAANKVSPDEDEEGDKDRICNGFLRIQLGDQTDSKMLLGQYRCTDVPGEFIWQAGVLTQAVMNGYWLLLEDIDLATQDVCIVLTNLLENNYLSVPGFRDCLRIAPGFQLFVTLRNQKQSNYSQHSTFQLLEKYLYIVNILPLTRSELSYMIAEIYPKFQSIADRMVDVFLTFSSGGHGDDEDDSPIRTNAIEPAEPLTGDSAMEVDSSQSNTVSTAGLSNSSRLVSTRDLLKWCKRSYPSFSGTSADYAMFVFKNAVDLFCSYLPHGPVRTAQMVQIGARLNISIGKCESLANDYAPEVQQSSDEMIVGRVKLDKRVSALNASDKKSVRNDDDLVLKKRKLEGDGNYLNVVQHIKQKAPTFSFTRLARCILERIAVSVQQNEPILLVGETGVGKTSSVQYLSYQTNHKLVVVNMNNQSDVSDLIGGFKPVDMAFVLLPLRTEFEFLFKQTFNPSKNEKFLNNLAVCFNRSEFGVLIKLMLRITETVFGKELKDSSRKQEIILQRWSALKVKLQKLNSQLKNSINISFAFIPGSLVNCIQNGDWVLLDEINLASTETLECLSTILEPEGSIVLLEKGDYVPIKRHPEFRIFACMNPSTDIGKKDLPTGIRNRFTEFYVDELTTIEDLQILIRDYLLNTGIKETKLHGIAKLYKKLRMLAQLDLNDGLGNRPVYSLRTLCRSLIICAKNMCGSVERNLYESFCLSFLTQLDPISHRIVLLLIQEAMLTNVKAVLSQPIPKPNGDYINFEGYWIQNGPKEVQACENYILTDSVKENLKDLARIVSIGKLPVLLQGPTSAGKTSLIEYVAKRSGNYCLRINNHEHTDLQEYIGTYTADVSGKLSFKEGVLVQAMRNGYWIILDELNLASSDILEALNRVLDDNRELFIPETQTLIKAHPNFMLFATQNPPGLYGGRKTLSRAFKNRFIELHFSEIPRPELEIILEKRCLIPKSYAQKMVKTMSELQVNRKTTVKGSFTLRDLFRWGNRYTFADPALLANNSYDWNQHLVDEGYLALSAKIRNDSEVAIIETTLFNNFRKKINLDHLFELSDKSSMVTRSILESIAKHPKYDGIVWTFNMRRMAVLAAKALEFNEPVLLVGSTGCGKTTICQILADSVPTELRILNCHMHTEGADFLGGLRPFRGEQSEDSSAPRQLFEWANGPLVLSMLEGSYFLADEISLAEDSVLERLNCILEPERTVLLAEKGGVSENFISADDVLNNAGEFIIVASKGFQFLATMNPGGDFGKKELSPALRNRFTEIWCRATDSKEDLCRIAAHTLRKDFNLIDDASVDTMIQDIASIVVNTVYHMKENIDKFNFSIRDVLAWIGYCTRNAHIKFNGVLSIPEALVFGLETMFLDSLEMLPHDSYAEIERIRGNALRFLIAEVRSKLQISLNLDDVLNKKGSTVEMSVERFGIAPFFIDRNTETQVVAKAAFMFTAPTTQRNLFRLLSALSLHKSILLEGPPGVGKTSLIESLTAAIGFNIVRINLCEHTDLADLFGTDLPATDPDQFDGKAKTEATALGSFVWRDGPLLAALKAPNTWILLDELNLAPQSVLEGLNAVLDHRGEVYIPELNKTFKLGTETRIFASQNPLKQGGGRKGLPQSFLNRFTKVYLRKLDQADLSHVVGSKYGTYFSNLAEYFGATTSIDAPSESVSLFEVKEYVQEPTTAYSFDLCLRMVQFSDRIDTGISNFEFGYKGGPFEVNLRDILRWCDFLSNDQTGFRLIPNAQVESAKTAEAFAEFLLVLYEKMKLVYYQRMRTEQDKTFIRRAFESVFACDADALEAKSQDISLYWTDDSVFFGDIRLQTSALTTGEEDAKPVLAVSRTKTSTPLVLTSQLEVLKNLAECLMLEKPVILCGPTDSGKTKAIDLLCTLVNRNCTVDTIDDSVTGSFQQVDFNRHLDEVAKSVEAELLTYAQHYALQHNGAGIDVVVRLMASWEEYEHVLESGHNNGPFNHSAMSDELQLFRKRLQSLARVFELIERTDFVHRDAHRLSTINSILTQLQRIIAQAETLNTGGHFEWVDSKIVTSFKNGQIICLEHVNLCSSAILDRLNPVFETDGTLLLSEKGVSIDNEPEIVHKHPDFRAFLTLDPKNGEISRAMRNRCIEMSINKESYTADNLKHIIYVNGIHEMYLINALLDIHQRCKAVSEFNQSGISHITKCSNLVAENIRLGYSPEKAVYVSALEVYVRSANTDLLGFGLGFYRNKLKQEIVDVVQTLKSSRTNNRFTYENVIVNSSKLNSFALIRKQCEPFVTVLRNFLNGSEATTASDLSDLFNEFGSVNLTSDASMLSLLLYILYEVGSIDDIQQRYIYLGDILRSELSSENSQLVHTLLKLNETIYIDLSSTCHKSENKSLPWNSRILPRLLTHYQGKELLLTHQLQLSALLLARVSLPSIDAQDTTKLSQIDAITYSRAVQTKIIQDTLDNGLLTHLFPFMDNLQSHVASILSGDISALSYDQYVNLISGFLWTQRVYEVSKRTLFSQKSVDQSLVDSLSLHFKWMQKHCLSTISNIMPSSHSNTGFHKHHSQIIQYIKANDHPMNLLRKQFVKSLTNFLPFYEEKQIETHDKIRRFQNGTILVPKMGGAFDEETMSTRMLALLDGHVNELKLHLATLLPNDLVFGSIGCQLESETGDCDEIETAVNIFLEAINDLAEVVTAHVPDDTFDLDAQFEYFEKFTATSNDLRSIALVVDQLPVLEYFALKCLNPIYLGRSQAHRINPQFIRRIKSIGINELEILRIVQSSAFPVCEQLWHKVLELLADTEDHESFGRILAVLPVDFYKNFASFDRSFVAKLQSFALTSIAAGRQFGSQNQSSLSWSGPILTGSILAALFDRSGEIRATGLGDLDAWRNSLKEYSQLVWSNVELVQDPFSFEHAHITSSHLYGVKLLKELEYVDNKCEQLNDITSLEFHTDFMKLKSMLVSNLNLASAHIIENPTNGLNALKATQRYNATHIASTINSLIGSIELNLLSYLPLLDPVEKNRLKKLYVEQDQTHFTQLIAAYDCIKVAMSYKGLAAETIGHFRQKLDQLELRQNKLAKKVALRPVDCLYANLVRDINHFLRTCCHPRSLVELLETVQLCLRSEIPAADVDVPAIQEVVKRIDLWINNASQFRHHTLAKYAGYYKDFLSPLENSVTMLRHGLVGLKHCLLKRSESLGRDAAGNVYDVGCDDAISRILENIVEFPNVNGLNVLPQRKTDAGFSVNIVHVLSKMEHYDATFFTLLKSKLYEIQKNITLECNITDEMFAEFNVVLSLFNGVWQKQEELRRQKIAEEESLYVTKTRCETEDDEELIEREVESMFPSTAEDDFGEFIGAVSLEQNAKRLRREQKAATGKKSTPDILQHDDIRDICDIFIDLMRRFSSSYYYKHKLHATEAELTDTSGHDYVTEYRRKTRVFHQLFGAYDACLNSRMDEMFYGGIGLVIGASMQKHDLLELNQNRNISSTYNFYKDPNIAEILNCTDVLKKLEVRVTAELALYPEHAGLIDIISIIGRIRSFPSTSPVVRFNTGFQILNKKVNEWNKLAHRNNTMLDLEEEVASHIQRWMKLELQCWRECLSQSYAKVQSKANRYWFFIYNLLNEYLSTGASPNVLNCDLTDFASVEKCFEATDYNALQDPEVKGERIRSKQVINVIKQFIESANYAEFHTRMSILKAFEQYLHHLNASQVDRRKNTLITIVHNLHTYFDQFTPEIDAQLKTFRSGVEKKLKEFVKVESYSKYLSYFSQEANIANVHRKLHKFLREYEQQLTQRISSVFILKENQIQDVNMDNEKGKNLRFEAKVKYYMVDVKHFIIPSKITERFPVATALDADVLQLLPKVDKLFGTSRNIVKHAILHSHFPSLIYNLDTVVGDHIESCDYLRKLEVDRTQEKPKQKVQAKQILQQKRKALTDLYKVLNSMGLSFRAGLMESGLTPELTDMKIAPFCIKTMLFDKTRKRVDQNLIYLNENMDSYFVKCMYKLKLLQTVLLTPNPDLGLQNLERVKGYAVDMFLLVQSQRKTVSSYVRQLHDLKDHIQDISDLNDCIVSGTEYLEDASFEQLRQQLDMIKLNLCKITDVFQQYEILLQCVPRETDPNFCAITNSTALSQNSPKFQLIQEACTSIQKQSRKTLLEVEKHDIDQFISVETIASIDNQFQNICKEIDTLYSHFEVTPGSRMVLGKAVSDLRLMLQQSEEAFIAANANQLQTPDLNEFENIDTELENIIHSALFSMQSIYKKYSLQTQQFYDNKEHSFEEKTNELTADIEAAEENGPSSDDLIEENHLKIKITAELHADLETLNVSKITAKLSTVLRSIRHSRNYATKVKTIEKIISVLPILEQYNMLCKFYLIQQIGAHKVASKMLAVMLTVFVELGAKGFCVPPDLMTDEDGDKGDEKEEKGGEGFGLEDGTGEKDVSDKLESEDQLDSAQKPGDDKETDDKEDADCKEEKGIDMSEDFDSKLQDLDKKEPNSDDSDDDEDDEEADKQMGETEDGAEKLDDQIWGSDEEKDEEEDEEEMNEEDNGKGSKDEEDQHNDPANKNEETAQGEEQSEGLDAADNDDKEKKKKEKDIDQLDEPDVGEDQVNPYHNELEEPPEPEDINLGDVNLDNEDANDKDEAPEDNPFDIDKMKDQMEVDEEAEENDEKAEGEEDETPKVDENSDDSDDENEAGETKRDEEENGEEDKTEEEEEKKDEPTDSTCPAPKEDEEEDKAGEENDPDSEKKEQNEEFHQSKDQASKEENAQSMPDDENKGSVDQVQNQKADEESKQQDDMDAQDTGEDQQAIGQAENEESKSGHQGIADTKESQTKEQQQNKKEQSEKRKQGNTNEERTLGDPEQQEKKQLKTIDKLNESEAKDSEKDEKPADEAEEYQHIKEAKPSDKTTLDNATEDQSKQITHEDNAKDEEQQEDDAAAIDEIMPDEPKNDEEEPDNVDKMQSEKLDQKSDKPSKNEPTQEQSEQADPIDVEGEKVDTFTVQRGTETSAHTAVDLLQDTSLPQEPSTAESLDMRKLFEKERMTTKLVQPSHADFDAWQTISNKMLPNARELCEQLRLILEPTKCTRLKGDYRTGRRINLKKIIPYIASQFRKDKIWLRRTKPAQRDYKITVAIDDSKSMHHNNSKELTLEAISLVSQALTLLESGRLSIMSFGESPQIILNHSDQFDGPKLVNALTFEQNQSRIAELLNFTRVASLEDGSSSDNGIFENLLIVLSDGRNIFSEGEQHVKNAVKLARLQRIFIVYIIIDNPDNKHSILDIRVPSFSADRKSIAMKSYLDTFPFPYYVIVRDLGQLPLVLSDAMRQWFELVNSEQ